MVYKVPTRKKVRNFLKLFTAPGFSKFFPKTPDKPTFNRNQSSRENQVIMRLLKKYFFLYAVQN
jgi:hypothetical protein